MQAQIQALLAVVGGVIGGVERGAAEVNRGYQMEVAKPAIFSGEVGKVGGFITACRLYLRMKMSNSGRTSPVGSLICAGRISRCVEGECDRRTGGRCYGLKLKGLSKRTTLVLSNTRELDRVP